MRSAAISVAQERLSVSAIGNAPDSTLLRIRYIKRAIWPYRHGHRAICGALTALILVTGAREAVSKRLRASRLAGSIHRYEHNVIATVKAFWITAGRAVKGDEGAAAIVELPRFGGQFIVFVS